MEQQKTIRIQEGKIITIDGDRFKMSIPSMEQWHVLEKFIRDNMEFHNNSEFLKYIPTTETFIVYSIADENEESDDDEDGVSSVIDYFVFGGDKDPYAAFSDKYRAIYTCPEYVDALVGFRPILIPLTKDNRPDKSFSEQNPDGTIVYGGQILVNRKAYGITHAPEPIPADDIWGSDALEIVSQTDQAKTDQEQNVIEWLVVNGMLFPTRALAVTSINHMFQQDILPLVAPDGV